MEIDPNYPNPYFIKGFILAQKGRKHEALKLIEKADELGDPYAPALIQTIKGFAGNKDVSNPLGITDDSNLNQPHTLPDLVSAFENDLANYFLILKDKNSKVFIDDIITLTVYYTINLLIEYRDKALYNLPRSIISNVKKQVLIAAQNKFGVFKETSSINELYSKIDKQIWEQNVVSETHEYMKQFK